MLSARDVSGILEENHYLGPSRRGVAYQDECGVIVLASPTSRRLPNGRWLDLVRWCILRGRGSEQWKRCVREIRAEFPEVTTVVSYSDPSAGHTGALYRACNWLWAPTWHRLRTPPTGNGSWKDGKAQAAKDRWVFLLQPDPDREEILRVKDNSLTRRMPWASYVEPRWKKGRHRSGGADYKKFLLHQKKQNEETSPPVVD